MVDCDPDCNDCNPDCNQVITSRITNCVAGTGIAMTAIQIAIRIVVLFFIQFLLFPSCTEMCGRMSLSMMNDNGAKEDQHQRDQAQEQED